MENMVLPMVGINGNFRCCLIFRARCSEKKRESKEERETLHSSLFTLHYTWGCSSAGRAPALQAGGQGFESPHLHQGRGPTWAYSSAG